ncbi:MAG: ABC transporter permease [Deltaproteobacteria bacterium]|nr:MAG: ABC transporter permease [Deltaproteobacteria bacterium]
MTMTLGRIVAIAATTFREAIRNRVLYVLVAFALALMAFSWVLGELSLHEEVRVITDLGLAGISLFGVIIALFLGVNLLRKELDEKTVYFVVPKPLERWEFIVGKYLGLVATLAVLVVAMSAILGALVEARGGDVSVLLVRAEVLIFFELVLLTAVGLFFSGFSSPYLSAMFAGGLWVAGRSTPELVALAEGKLAGTPAGALVEAVAAVLPDFHLFYVSGSNVAGEVVTIHETFVSWAYVGTTAAYGVGYAAVAVVLASVLFSRRDLT